MTDDGTSDPPAVGPNRRATDGDRFLLPRAVSSASPESLALLEATDWSATPLGPRDGWSRSLRMAVKLCLSSRFPMFVWWGETFVNVYNDAYRPILGKRHPQAFGQPAASVWPEIWNEVGTQARHIMQRGESTWYERVLLVLERNGRPEDAWFTWSYSPIYDDAGQVGGVFCACTEDTARVVAERERDALLAQAQADTERRRRAETRDRFVIALDEAVRPLADPAEITATHARLLCEHLGANRCAYAEVLADEDTFDVTGGHDRGVPSIVGRYRFADFGPEVLALMRAGRPYVVDDVEHHTPPIADLAAYRQTAIRSVVCVPLRKASRLVAAMAVHQAEPRHWRDDEIELVLHVTTRCLESIEHACAQRRLRESEQRFRVAALIATSIVWTNDAAGQMVGEQPGWQAFTGQSRADCQGYGWGAALHPDDVPATVTAWEKAVARRSEFVHRHRVRRADGRWRTCDVRALPMFDLHGAVSEWVGVHSDVTDRLAFEQTVQESEARFRNLSDNAPVMIWVTRPDGYCEYLNRGWYEFTGQTPDQALGFGWLRAVHPDDSKAAEVEFLAANAEQREFRIEYRLRRHDGAYRWCIDSAVPRRGADGAPLGFIGSVFDISERKQTENALAAEKRVLQLIATGASLAAALDAIVVGVEEQCDHAVRCAILRVAADDGAVLKVASAPSLPAGFADAVEGGALRLGFGARAAVDDGAAADAGTDVDRDVGTSTAGIFAVVDDDLSGPASPPPLREVATRHGLRASIVAPILKPGGAGYGSFAVFYRRPGAPDPAHVERAIAATHLAAIVFEKHALDEQLQQSLGAEQAARGEAERASRMKDEFLATLSHELRTPLSAILGWAAVLRRRGGLTEEVGRGITVIERNARAQSQIIADLLDMSAIVSGKVRLDIATVDLPAFVALAVETVRPMAAAKGVSVHCHAKEAGELDVRGDASRLQQILWNLLSNAVKFSHPGGRVDVALWADGAQAVLEIRDDGDGIAAEFLPFLFDRFRQADASTTRAKGGLGLGLSIVAKLVELHQGSVAADSAGLGRGATFTARLPRAVRQDAPGVYGALPAGRVPPPRRAERPSSADAGMNVEPALDGLRVLLVDDDDDGRETTQRLLELKHVAVTPAGSADEALRCAERDSFDVIVSDIGMPQVDGYELMRRLRALEARRGGPALTAIALTAYARNEDRVKAIDAGFDLHLTKPTDATRLYGALATAPRRHGSPAPR